MQVSSTIENQTLQQTFKESELPTLLETIREEHPYCEVYLECPGPRKPRKRVLIFQNGDIGYCGDRKPCLEDYVGLIHHKINSDWIDRVFEDSQVNMQEEMAPLQFIQRLLQFRVLQKGDIIKLQISAFLLSLEPIYRSEGTLTINVLSEQDRYMPVEWRLINLALEKRKKTWLKLAKHHCTMNSVPIMTEEAINLIRNDDTLASEHENLLSFIEKIIDSRSNIIDIAERYRTDPLSLAQKLTQGSINGFVNFLDEAQEPNFNIRANVLVVDENSTTRKLLVKLLQSCYDAHETSGTLEAVSMIPSKNIDALIVSQSIPINSSFQLCRIIRQNPDFKHLPIIFIANKESFFEKAKAKMAGVTEYLTQPLDQTKILSILDLHT